MTGRIMKNVLSAAGQLVAQTVVLFFLYRYLIGSIGIERLGVWSVILATVSAARISELGLAGSTTKFVAGYRAQGDEQSARELLETAALTLGAVLGVVLLIGYPALVWLMPHVLPPVALEDGRSILPYALVSLWFTALAAIWLSGLDACLRSDLRAALMIFVSLLYFVMAIGAVSRYGLVGLAIAQVIQSAVLAVLGWFVVRRTMRTESVFPKTWRAKFFREMLGYGVNFQINSVVVLLFEPATKILLGRYGELSAAGYFELAQRLVTKVRALVVESNRVIVPVLAGLDEASKTSAQTIYCKNMRYLFFLVTPLFASLSALVPGISVLWIGEYQREFMIMAVCLAGAWYFNSISAPAYFAYLGQGRLKWVTLAHVFMGISNIVLGLLLGHFFGWPGIFAAFTLSLMAGSLFQVWMYHREHQLKTRKIFQFHDMAFAIVCAGAGALGLGIHIFQPSMAAVQQTALVVGLLGIVLVSAVWLHPLRTDFLLLMRAGLGRAHPKC